MRIGVIGAGSAGSRHAKIFSFLGEVSTYDVIPDKAQQKDQRSLMEWADAIVIATPPSTHAALLEECIDRRLPVLVEKPLATDSKGLATLLRQAALKKVPVMVGYQWRHAASLQGFKAMVLRIEGRYWVSGMYSQGLKFRPTPSWLHDPEEGGCLLENSHLIDMLVFLFGRFAVIHATIRDAIVLMEIAWTPDCHGQIEMDHLYPGTIGEIVVVGNKSVTKWDRLQEADLGRLYGIQAAHFIDVIEHPQITPRVTGWDGLAVLEIAEEARRCSR